MAVHQSANLTRSRRGEVGIAVVGLAMAALGAARAAPQVPTDRFAVSGVHPRRREKSTGPLKQIWRFFGADEPNYATCRAAGS